MGWFLIDKSSAVQPDGTYSDWKGILREEGRYQCVYCSIREGEFGGERNFHVEHYRPKSKYTDEVNDIRNLFYCCSICNSFKGSDWPQSPQPDHSVCAYPNPSVVDYSTILSIDDNSFAVSNLVAGKYVIERLYINRPQVLMVRKTDRILEEITVLAREVVQAFSTGIDDAGIRESLANALEDALALLATIRHVRPYEPNDTRRLVRGI